MKLASYQVPECVRYVNKLSKVGEINQEGKPPGSDKYEQIRGV